MVSFPCTEIYKGIYYLMNLSHAYQTPIMCHTLKLEMTKTDTVDHIKMHSVVEIWLGKQRVKKNTSPTVLRQSVRITFPIYLPNWQ